MPELPDVVVYLERLEALVGGRHLLRIRLASPWVLRTVEPAITSIEGKRLIGLRRIGKRLVLELEGDLFVIIHLMVAGRLRMRPAGAPIPAKRGLAAFDFPHVTILLTEEGTKKRASIHLVRGAAGLAAHECRDCHGSVEPELVTIYPASEVCLDCMPRLELQRLQ